MTIQKELEQIICKRIGDAAERVFSIREYLNQGRMSEQDLIDAIKVLLKKRAKRAKIR